MLFEVQININNNLFEPLLYMFILYMYVTEWLMTYSVFSVTQVTTKGAGLNPNAKVWQEVPAHHTDAPEGTENSPWLQACPPQTEMTNGRSLQFLLCLYLLFVCVYCVQEWGETTHTHTRYQMNVFQVYSSW